MLLSVHLTRPTYQMCHLRWKGLTSRVGFCSAGDRSKLFDLSRRRYEPRSVSLRLSSHEFIKTGLGGCLAEPKFDDPAPFAEAGLAPRMEDFLQTSGLGLLACEEENSYTWFLYSLIARRDLWMFRKLKMLASGWSPN